MRALHAPAFGHELVKRLVALTLDGGASDEALATKLLGRLMGVELLSPEQLQLGCRRLVDDVADLRLDNPRAPRLIAAFLTRCCGPRTRRLVARRGGAPRRLSAGVAGGRERAGGRAGDDGWRSCMWRSMRHLAGILGKGRDLGAYSWCEVVVTRGREYH